MGVLDIAAKAVLRAAPGDLVRLALGRKVRVVAAEDTELPAQALRMDKVLRVSAAAGSSLPWWLHVEVFARWRVKVPERSMRYFVRAREPFPRLETLVLLLRPGRKQGRPVDRFVQVGRDGRPVLEFRYHLVKAWELDVEQLLAEGAPGLLPLVPFARGTSPRHVEAALERLGAVRSRALRAELQGATVLLAGAVFPGRSWEATIPEEILMQSPVYTRAKAKGAREMLALQLSLRLGSEPAEWALRLEACDRAALESITRAVVASRAKRTLRAAVDQALETPPPPRRRRETK